MIDVILLGTGSMVPLPGRWLSSALVRVNSRLMLLDCGEGTQIAMRERHWGFRKLDTICLSHLHADHVAGVPGLLHTIANAGKTDPLMIYGPSGTKAVMEGLRTIAPVVPYDVIVQELADGDVAEGPAGLRITVAEGVHRVPVLAYRFDRPRLPRFAPERATALGVPQQDWSKLQQGQTVMVGEREILPSEVMGEQRSGVALGFVTDSRPTDPVRDLVRGVDLLISEATFGSDDDAGKAERRGHMTFREAATLARDAEAGHLWLTHFSAGMEDPPMWRDNAAKVMPKVSVGYSGLEATLAFDDGYQQPAEATAGAAQG